MGLSHICFLVLADHEDEQMDLDDEQMDSGDDEKHHVKKSGKFFEYMGGVL